MLIVLQKNGNMIHYIYKIIFLKGKPENRYYIGKRSTGEYDNWKEAADAVGAAFQNIQSVCNGLCRKAKGYVWKNLD